jgi:hypothetical protein
MTRILLAEGIAAPLLPQLVRIEVGKRLIAITDALDAAGLRVYLAHDLDTIARIKRDTGQILFQPFNPDFWPNVGGPHEVVVVMVERDGKVVACCATRRIELENSLYDNLVTRRLFYANPHVAGREGRCIVTAELAHQIEDCPIALSGCVWVDASVMQHRLVEPMMRIAHTWAISTWYVTWLIGFAEERVTRLLGFDAYGYDQAHRRVAMDFPALGINVDTFLLASTRRKARGLYLPSPDAIRDPSEEGQ